LTDRTSFLKVIELLQIFLPYFFYNFISNSTKAFLSGHLSILLISFRGCIYAFPKGKKTDPAGMRPLDDFK
jgi:hypothetical protein